MSGAKRPIKGAQRTVDILNTLQALDGAGVTELAEHVGLSKGSVHAYLATLEENGFVVKENGAYYVGLQIVDMAYYAKNRVFSFELVKQEVERLATETGEVALFSVEENGSGICLHKARGENTDPTDLYADYQNGLAHTNGLHHTAVGKAILAFLPDERVGEILANTEFIALTENTIVKEDALRRELQEIRQQNVAYNWEETIQGVVSVAVPVLTQRGEVHGALGVMGPKDRLGDHYQSSILSELERSVRTLEASIPGVS